MNEMEVYAPGVRQPAYLLGLALEFDAIPHLNYKVDTNHDLVYLESIGPLPSKEMLSSVFSKLGLESRFVGRPAEVFTDLKKTQRLA
jgi:hypothetical protein